MQLSHTACILCIVGAVNVNCVVGHTNSGGRINKGAVK